MDTAEFDELYASSYVRLVAQLHALTGSRDEAEECVQEAFVRAWANRRRLHAEQRPEAWVRRTAYRLAVSRWRRVVRGRRPPDRALSAAFVSPPLSEAHVALVTALRALPVEQRVALVLHDKARLSRGRAGLARLLDDDVQEGTHHA